MTQPPNRPNSPRSNKRLNLLPFKALLEAAHDFADLSGPAVLKSFRRPISVDNKAEGGFDPVTVADRAAEKVIAKALKARFPDHALTGEEFGDLAGLCPYRWIVDPIDGTRSFIMGSPLWGTLIGLMDGDEPLLGLMDQPFTGERFWSSEKKAHMRRGPSGKATTLATRPCVRLADAVLTSTHPGLFAKGREQDILHRFEKSVRMSRFGGDCYGYCLLAAGFVDIIIEPGLKTYDIAPLIPIIERAGGMVTTWSGDPAGAGGDIIACGDRRVHEAALKLIDKA